MATSDASFQWLGFAPVGGNPTQAPLSLRPERAASAVMAALTSFLDWIHRRISSPFFRSHSMRRKPAPRISRRSIASFSAASLFAVTALAAQVAGNQFPEGAALLVRLRIARFLQARGLV